MLSLYLVLSPMATMPSQSSSAWITGLRRFGSTTYLLSIALGLYTIVNVVRLQSKRIRDLGEEPSIKPA